MSESPVEAKEWIKFGYPRPTSEDSHSVGTGFPLCLKGSTSDSDTMHRHSVKLLLYVK